MMKIGSPNFHSHELDLRAKISSPAFLLCKNSHKNPRNNSHGNLRNNSRGRILLPLAALALAIAGVLSLSGKIWADHTGMTPIFFSDHLFCTAVSASFGENSLDDGDVYGGDCGSHNLLYISSAKIDKIHTITIAPEPGYYDDISNSMSIDGGWVSAFENLTSLTIKNMPIEDITNLKNLHGNLTYLDLSNNQISDVTPLKESSKLKDNLTYLDLSGNPLGGALRPLSRLGQLTTLIIANTDTSDIGDLFAPPETEIIYDEETEEPKSIVDVETGDEWPVVVDPETGEVSGGPTSSDLARKLLTLDMSKNEGVSSDITEDTEEEEQVCSGSLASFETYAKDLVLTKLIASGDNLNTTDLRCVATLRHLDDLNVSENHIEDFSPIKNKTYSALDARSQVFKRYVAGLDYNLSQTLFSQAGTENYFYNMLPNVHNTKVDLEDLTKDNAELNGRQVRIYDAVKASESAQDPQPATIMVPSGTGVFEGSRLEVYFTGQIVTFKDTNLCNSVYTQGRSGDAFYDEHSNQTWSGEEPIVLTNACDTRKQIAMISGGSSLFLTLVLDNINGGEVVDLTGLGDFDGLQRLSLNNNNLTSIGVLSNTSSLRQLWLDNNKLDNEAWWTITDNLTNLGYLSLNNNNMNEIPQSIENLYPNLGTLRLVNNGISDVSPLARVSSLTALDLSENRGITDFSGLASDESACDPWDLKIENAGITRLPSADLIQRGFQHLETLTLNGNQLTDETISGLSKAPRLRGLYLNNNKISSSSRFSEIDSLVILYLNDNLLTETSGFESLTNLQKLYLDRNQISNLTDLNTAPALDTLSVNNQTLTGSTSDPEATFTLPAVFSQAKTMTFPKVGGFNSTENYAVTNGTINYDTMTVTMTNTSEPTTVTISENDGGLAGTVITITYESEDFAGNITNRTNSGVTTIDSTSRTSFTVTSAIPCFVIYSRDSGATWTRIVSSSVPDVANARAFTLDQPDGAEVVVAYAGDVQSPLGSVNALDVLKIKHSIIKKITLSALEEKIADVDSNTGVNVLDALAISRSIIGKGNINW